jgi:hypothetical protein
MAVKFSNNAVTTLSADISAGATSFTVASATPFPTLASGDWTYVSLTSEVVKIDTISGNTFELFENDTVQSPHTSGESVELRMTAELLNDFAEDTESLPIGGGTMTGDVSLSNATYVSQNDNASAVPRILGINSGNTTYIGPIDAYAGGSILYGVSANVSNQIFYTSADARLNIASNGDISFYEDTGTTPKFFWDASAESLGIGTTNPVTKLHINHGVARTSTGKTYTSFIASNDTDDFRFGLATAFKGGATSVDRYTSIDSASYQVSTGAFTGGSDLILQSLGGNVGIGSTPAAKLHVNGGAAYAAIRLGATNITSRYGQFSQLSATDFSLELSGTGTNLLFKTNSAERLRINSAGNVGVGTSSPQSRIDVGGGYMANEQGRTDHVANTMPSPYYHFDGSDKVSTPSVSFTSTDTWTAHITFRIDDTSSGNWMGLLGDTGDGYIMIHNSGSEIAYKDSTAAYKYSSAVPENMVGRWVQVTVVGSDSGVYFYADGVAQGSATAPLNVTFNQIGEVDSRNLRGSISDVKIFNTALTADEVKELYSGASVPFKYKGASQTELVTNGTFATGDLKGWTTGANWSVSGGIATVVSVPNSYVMQTILETGKTYRLQFDITSITSGYISLYTNNPTWVNMAGWTTAGTHTATFTYKGTDGKIYLYGLGEPSLSIDNVSVVQIGAVAEYDGSSATTGTWYDKSGNGLDGTVTGATLENKGNGLAPVTSTAPNNPAQGDMWFDSTGSAMKVWSGSDWDTMSNKFTASGGTESTYSSGGVNYNVHTFTSSGTFTAEASGSVDVLVVAGGGAGGGSLGGGGGAGGLRVITGISVSASNYDIIVGGGASGTAGTGGDGGTSSSIGYSTVGGGGGSGGATYDCGRSGGSGGGGSRTNGGSSYNYCSGAGTSGQGYAGGTGVHTYAPDSSRNEHGGGGGGASSVGIDGHASSAGADGGSGTASSYGGTSYYYAGGGGGGTHSSGTRAANGGIGGGGGGGTSTLTTLGVGGGSARNSGGNGFGSYGAGGAGGVNTGSGGGGGGWNSAFGGNGGSGIVVIRYAV